jgi:ribosomal protein L32
VAHCDPEPKPKASERRRNKKRSKKRDSFGKETIVVMQRCVDFL